MSDKYYLPALAMVKDAFFYVASERKNFIAMAALPIVGLSIIGTLLAFFYPDPFIIADPENQTASVNSEILVAYLPAYLLNGILYVMFAVAWHRKWLVGETDITIYSALKWDGRKTKFLGRSIQIIGLSFGVLFILSQLMLLISGNGNFLLSPIGFMLALATLTLTFGRFSLLLPAAAVDDEMNFKSCWHITDGNSWRLGILAILPPIPLAFIQLIIQAILFSIFEAINVTDSLAVNLILHLIQQAFNYFAIAVGVSALSMAYQDFKTHGPQIEEIQD